VLEARFSIDLEKKTLDEYRKMLTMGYAGAWEGIKGLRNKYFTIHEGNKVTEFYTFISKNKMKKYMEGNLWKSLAKMPG
jgi:hypothetical protein